MKLLSILLLVGITWWNNGDTKTVYDFTVKTIDEEPVSLEKYKGRVLLIVNTASHCGLTPQYTDLQATYEKYQEQGLVVLGFPANNFMGQESGKNEQIKEFCSSKFQITFPMFSKISVKGKNIHPLYAYLTSKKENGVIDAPVRWNFQKFLISKSGKVLEVFAPNQKVTKIAVQQAIKKALADKKM